MKSFKQFIAEMSYTDAASLFGLGKSFTAAELKSAYKKMALANHPDRGGSEEMMKKVNDAYETLKKRVGGSSSVSNDVMDGFRKVKEWLKIMNPLVLNSMLTTFNADIWLEHFNKYATVPLKYEIRPTQTTRVSDYASFDAEFFDDEKNTSLKIHVRAALVPMYNSSELGSSELSYPISITMEGYHAGKKQRFKRTEYERSNDHKVLKDPNILFPAAKLKKMFATGTTSGKARAIKRADVALHWKNKVGGEISGDYYVAGNKVGYSWKPPSIRLYRMVLMRKPAYSISRVNEELFSSVAFFYESQLVIDMMTEIGDSLKKNMNKPEKFKTDVEKIVAKYKTKQEKMG